MSLRGKVAVVTGASRGLGRYIASALAAQGAQVALLARRSVDLDTAVANIGERALQVICDVSDPAGVAAAFALVVSKFGRLDILVNNAAISELHRLEDASVDSIQREIAVNFTGPMLCCRAAIPLLRAAGGGDIVNISSEAVRQPFPYLTVYAATKAGLESLSMGLRTELRAEGIRVTAMRCGHIAESSISRHWPSETRAQYSKAMQISGQAAFTGKPVPPEIVASALINNLLLPRDVNVDLLELRSNLPAANASEAKLT